MTAESEMFEYLLAAIEENEDDDVGASDGQSETPRAARSSLHTSNPNPDRRGDQVCVCVFKSVFIGLPQLSTRDVHSTCLSPCVSL